jgi:hypothetical protein
VNADVQRGLPRMPKRLLTDRLGASGNHEVKGDEGGGTSWGMTTGGDAVSSERSARHLDCCVTRVSERTARNGSPNGLHTPAVKSNTG